MKGRKIKNLLIGLMISFVFSINAFAGQWKLDNTGWWYENDDGSYPVNTWFNVNGQWYYSDIKGYMLTGWLYDRNDYYYLERNNGNMLTGWQILGGEWYYFHNNGIMACNEWVGDYYLDFLGNMARNCWIGQYWVGNDGKYVPSKNMDNSSTGTNNSSSTGTNHNSSTGTTKEEVVPPTVETTEEYKEPEKEPEKPASTLSISGETKPQEIEQGNWFGLYGIISSNYSIEEVCGQILQNNKLIQSKIVYPGSMSYDLHGEINDALIFNVLSAGNYIYQITAKDASGTSKVLIKQQFQIKEPEKPESTLSISGETKPQEIEQGSWFGLYGIITSNYPIETVCGEIVQGDNLIQNKWVYPGTTEYDLHGEINDALIFNNLPAGNYTYHVMAQDTSGTRKMLIVQPFKVIAKNVPVTSGGTNVAGTEFEERVNEIREMFPVNTYWKSSSGNDPSGYTSDGSGIGNMFDNAWQCNGFAKYFYYYVYGQRSTSLYDPSSNIPTSTVRIGDYVRIGNDEHSIFVTDIYKGSDGHTYWKVAREVWGSSGNIIKECEYRVLDNTRIQYGSRRYTIDAIRRADNNLRRSVGLSDAPTLN